MSIPLCRRTTVIAVAFLSMTLLAGTGVGQEKARNDLNPIVVDLDQPAKYVYKFEVMAKLPIGAKPGEIGVKTQEDMSAEIPDSIALDRSGDIYVHDLVNRRIEKFDRTGKFKGIQFQYSNMQEPESPASQVSIDSRGHIFLNLVLRSSGKPVHWEIANNKIIKRHSQLTLPGPWTGADIPVVNVATWTIRGAQVSIENTSKTQRKQVIFQATRGLDQFETVLITNSRVFFRVKVAGQWSIVNLDIGRNSYQRIDQPADLFVQDGSQNIYSGMTPEGFMYALRVDEPGGLGAFDYVAEIVKVVPTEGK